VQRLAALFWNAREVRLRAAWRLILQVTGMTVICAIWQMSLPRGMTADQLNDIGAMILATLSIMAACRWLDQRSLAGLGWRADPKSLKQLLLGLTLGALLMSALFAAALAAGWASVSEASHLTAGLHAFDGGWLLTPAYFIAVGLAEEFYFRGYLLRNIAEGLRGRWMSARGALWTAALLSSGLFALAHAHQAQASPLSLFNTFLAGMLLAIAVLYRKSLAYAIGFHIAWNYFQGGVFGFLVSGSEQRAPLLAIDLGGPPLWTGGAYGPEGGLLGTFALAVGLLFTLLWGRARRGSWRVRFSRNA